MGKQQISTGTIAVVLAVVIVVLGIIAWRMFGTPSASTAQTGQAYEQMQQDMLRRMQGGQAPTGVAPTGPGGAAPAPGGAMPGPAPGAMPAPTPGGR